MKNILFCVFFAFINAKSKWYLIITLSTKIALILEKYKINECFYVVDKFFTSQTLHKRLNVVDKIIKNSKNALTAITNFKNT